MRLKPADGLRSFQKRFGAAATCIDARDGIGPHHLAIGKTRKLYESGNAIEAFYSEGYEIAHVRLDAETLGVRERDTLGFPVAWGGGAFCLDADEKGHVALAFVHRNRHELCFAHGVTAAQGVEWSAWRSLIGTNALQAAPWLEFGPDGAAWCSVLARDGDVRLALVEADGRAQTAPLFAAHDARWHHSCVQVLPIAADRAVAVGFRGDFPTKTELVFKIVERDLSSGPSQPLAPCNVNDQLTFHFQAAGDPARGRAHVVYLDEGLRVSHAMCAGRDWTVCRNVIPFPAFAPQICIDRSGRIALLACDYEGALWTASWNERTGWTRATCVEDVPPCTISGLFGRTGYGSGGLIAAARSPSGRVPFLLAAISDERSAHAKLYSGSLGRGSGLQLANHPIDARLEAGVLRGTIFLGFLRQEDLEQGQKCWLVGLPMAGEAPLKLAITCVDGVPVAQLYRHGSSGLERVRCPRAKVGVQFRDAFEQSADRAAISFEIEWPLPAPPVTSGAWIESYDGPWQPGARAPTGALIDVVPFQPEAAALTALDPTSIPRLFKRLI